MTAPEPKFDAELAWDIQEWADDETAQRGQGGAQALTRYEVKQLAVFLTEKGYSKGKSSGIGGLLSTLEEMGTKVVDEFGPVLDSLRKPK